MTRLLLLAVPLCAMLLSTTACPGRQQLAGLSDSTFVDVMARLHRIETDTRLSREQRDSARAIVLQSEGLTPEQLERAAQSLADRPDRAISLWRAIEQRALEPPPEPAPPPAAATPATPPRDPRTPDHAH